MAKNDTILVDGILDDRVEMKLPSERRDEVFEYFAFEQILKDTDLSKEEILSGSVDGRHDGGIDGFFIFVNGHLLIDPEAFVWPKAGAELEVWIITCKHHETFLQAPLDNLVASLSELLNLGLDRNKLAGDYSSQILSYRENLKFAYRKLAARMNRFSINFVYASRGDTDNLGESVISRGQQLENLPKGYFSTCESKFSFFGSTELVELHRQRPNFTLELPFLEHLSRGKSYVLLANIEDYYKFVTDNGRLRRYLFDSNVRDFMGLNRVNEDIRDTLKQTDSPDFWWLNNGITILATSAPVDGKTIILENIQIVNGLQTTESIFRFFENGGADPQERSVLIKVIVSNEAEIRDSIIRATNNQTDVELASLHATDKIQRDIEDVLARNGLYYERRKNYYANQGHSPSEIVNPLYIASGYLSLILKNPAKASHLRSRFMRSKNQYDKVFSPKVPLKIWPRIAFLLKSTDSVLEKIRPTQRKGATERFLKYWRHITCFLTVSKLIGNYYFSAKELLNLDLSRYTEDEVKSMWHFIDSASSSGGGSKSRLRLKKTVITVCRAASEEFGIEGVQAVIRSRTIQDDGREVPYKANMDFALKVHALLPEQPWKPGLHKQITKALNCTNKAFFDAVALLIEEGMWNRQKDGVVYDQEGNILSFDPERVDPETMQLFEIESTEIEE